MICTVNGFLLCMRTYKYIDTFDMCNDAFVITKSGFERSSFCERKVKSISI